MTSPGLNLNKVPSDPTLKDLLDLHKKEIMLNLNCHAIATIQSFNSTKQTVTATVNYKKTFFTFNEVTKTYTPVYVDYPLLIDCPVVIMSGGDGALTFPIASGDECLILFNDRDMDNWFQSGQPGPVSTPRLHSFSDGVALIGVRSMNRVLTYDATRVVLNKGTTKLGLSAKVMLQNGSTSLKTILENLFNTLTNDLITAFGAATPSPGSPLNPTAVSALTSFQSTINSTIEGLLE